MPPVVVVGYGNCLRGDDGIGRRAAQSLALRLPAQTAAVLEAHQLLPEMADVMSRAQLVVLIDAAVGSPAGAISQRLVAPAEGENMAASILGHHLSPEQMLAACDRLYSARPEMVLFTVCSQFFAFEERLSEPAQQALPELIERVEQVILGRFPPV